MSIPVSGEIWFKAQRVIRTSIQVIVSIILAVAAFLAVFNVVAPQILEEVRELLPAEFYLWLVGFIAVTTTIAGVLARVMAIPAVDAFLKKFGAGSAPRSAATPGELTRREYRDTL